MLSLFLQTKRGDKDIKILISDGNVGVKEFKTTEICTNELRRPQILCWKICTDCLGLSSSVFFLLKLAWDCQKYENWL